MHTNLLKKKEECRDNWYALFVETGQEDKVRERVIYRFKDKLKVFVPKRKLKERKNGTWTENIRILFPGYVLLNGYLEKGEVSSFTTIPGIYKLLKDEQEPLRIESQEIEVINRLAHNNDTIGFSEVLVEDGNVKVVDGPLMNLEGQIVSIDKRKGRAKVQLSFLGECRTIELGVSVLQPA